MTQATQDPPRKDKANGDVFHQAAENFRSAMDTGIRFQKDAFEALTAVLNGGRTFEDVRQRFENLATDSIGVMRKNAEDAQRLFDEGCKTSTELFRKSLATANVGESTDVMNRTKEAWESTFDAMRTTMEAAARTGARAIENWSEFFSRSMSSCEAKAGR